MDPECNETSQEARYQQWTEASTPSPHPSLWKMTAKPLIGRDLFVHLSRRHKHPLLGYISVRQILTFHLYEFSETACTHNTLTASYFSSQSLSACVSIWNRKASTQHPIPSLYFRANHYRHVVQSTIRYSGAWLLLFWPLFIVMAPE